MPEQNNADLRPSIENCFEKVLKGDALKNALDFVAYVRASGFTNDDDYNNNFYFMGEPTFVLLCFENDNFPEGE